MYVLSHYFQVALGIIERCCVEQVERRIAKTEFVVYAFVCFIQCLLSGETRGDDAPAHACDAERSGVSVSLFGENMKDDPQNRTATFVRQFLCQCFEGVCSLCANTECRLVETRCIGWLPYKSISGKLWTVLRCIGMSGKRDRRDDQCRVFEVEYRLSCGEEYTADSIL